MLTSKRRTAIVLAALMFVGVVALRFGVAAAWDLGARDIQRFAERPYGFQVPSDTAGFFLTWTRGDGQAFMSIAADLNGDGVSSGLGYHSYRMTRILPSALARMLALGETSLLAYGLAATSFAAYGGLLLASVKLTDVLGLRAMFLGLSPAALAGTVFDTAEGLGSFLLVMGITSSSIVLAVASSALLGVARPSYGTAVVASRIGLKAPAATIGSAFCLQMIVLFVFDLDFVGSAGNLGLPFIGYVSGLPGVRGPVIASAAFVFGMAAVLTWYAFDRGYLAGYRTAAGLTAFLAVSLGPSTFVGPMSPLRVSGALFILIVLAPMFRHDASTGSSSDTFTGAQRRRATAGT